jgi:hypothetical protein
MEATMLLLTLLLSLLVSVSPVQKAHDSTRHIAQRTNIDRDLCSATVVGPYALLTASHCELPMTPSQSKKVPSSLTSWAASATAPTTRSILWPTSSTRAAEINEHDALSQGEDVFVFGNPGDWHDIYRRGYVAGLLDDEVLFDLPVFHGDSGMGIFNAQGQLLAC